MTQVSVILHGSACGLKMIRKLNKKMIKRLRHPGSSSNFLNKFLYNFERSDPNITSGRPAAKRPKSQWYDELAKLE